MNSIFFNTKFFVNIAAALVLAAGALAAFLFLEKPERDLFNYLPTNINAWIYQDGHSLTLEEKEFLSILGLEQHIVRVLAAAKNEFFLYQTPEGQWQELSWSLIEPNQKVWRTKEKQFYQPGFLVGYFKDWNFFGFKRLGLQDFNLSYFALKKQKTYLDFVLADFKTIDFHQFKFNQTDLINDKILFYLKTDDQEFLEQTAYFFKNYIKNQNAFNFPVLVSSVLPDQTKFQERKVDPTLFKWQEKNDDFFVLSLDQEKVVAADLANQLSGFSDNFSYYQNDNCFILGTSNSMDTSFSLFNQMVLNPNLNDGFFLNLDTDSSILTPLLVDSEFLKKIQDLGVKKITVSDQNEILFGRLIF